MAGPSVGLFRTCLLAGFRAKACAELPAGPSVGLVRAHPLPSSPSEGWRGTVWRSGYAALCRGILRDVGLERRALHGVLVGLVAGDDLAPDQVHQHAVQALHARTLARLDRADRSEERRVGKECGSRGWSERDTNDS